MERLELPFLQHLDAIRPRLTARPSYSAADDRECFCTVCHDRGIILEDGGRLARICSCQERRRVERLFQASRITPAFRAKTFEAFTLEGRPPVVKSMYDCARSYLRGLVMGSLGVHNWLALLGAPGVGKTHLCLAVCNELLADGVPVLYFPHVEGFSELRGAVGSEDKLFARVEAMKRVQVLYWDDLYKGRGAPTDFVLEVIFEVINHRYMEGLPTLISSERSPEELLAIDEAIGSRILERAKGHLVVAEGAEVNYRLGLGG